MSPDFGSMLRELSGSMGLDETANDAGQTALLASIAESSDGWQDSDNLAQVASILEATALMAYKAGTSRVGESPSQRRRAEDLFAQTGSCLRMLAELQATGEDAPLIDDEVLPGSLDLPFRIAVAGLVSRRTSDVRLALDELIVHGNDVAAQRQGVVVHVSELTWEERLVADAFGAFILLVRKRDGWADIDQALAALARLRGLQEQLQPRFLQRAADEGRQHEAALRLVGLFHVVQAVTVAGRYLQDGGAALPTIARIDRHRDHAAEAFEQIVGGGNATLMVLVDLLWAGCRELVRNSIWAHVEGLGEQIQAFAGELASRGRPNPVLELWPSQQEALSANILDTYRRAVLVQMPTSSGKTLLAEFLIIQSKALLPKATVVYVVPTRALVNQVTRDLRSDLGPLGMEIEQAVPAYELDPAETAMLSDAPDVLVSTPEKLSLLVRRGHPAVENLGLIVVDEAHNLADGERGARLELLLATIRRDRPGARYLLLSPFLPDAEQLVDWLGDDRGLPPVAINWRPGRRVVGTVMVTGRRPTRDLRFSTLEAAGSVDVGAGRTAHLGVVSNADLTAAKSVKATTRLAARALRSRGTTLVLCWGPAYAMDRAQEIASEAEVMPPDGFRNAVAKYLQAEYGNDASIARLIMSGVAYHHSGMSQESRTLVECLVRRRLVHTVCGTTTLAQGVNFPISNVLIETKRKGRDQELSYADLWNVVGRAGRALMDDAGLIAFPVSDAAQAEVWQQFLRGEAEAIASQLTELIDKAEQLGDIGLREVRNIPVLTDMLQFLAHAMHVGGARQTAAQLEDLLRSSLVYRQASEEPDRANQLLRLCRRYLTQVANQPGQVALSDQTGFSTPSVGLIMGSQRDNPNLADAASWEPAALFGADTEPLTDRMRVLGGVPELSLGYEDAGTFNPQRAAEIVAGWVNGVPMAALAEQYGDADASPEKRLASFARYLYSTLSYKASWGLGAMEAVYLSGQSASTPSGSTAQYVPSMVYFGVGSPEAVWMRMAGLPRVAAPGAGELWQEQVREHPTSYKQLRTWLSGLSTSEWARAVGGHAMTGAEIQRLWREALA